MPIVAAALKAKMQTRIFNALKEKFKDDIKDNDKGVESLMKQAEAISGIAEDICEMLLTQVQVSPGIPVVTAGSPAAQSGATTAPGKLI
jgi:hypothetical protein